ncbi:MAG: hypothetical protein ACJAW8_000032 [Oleispira sp.]|jgi:hypothetical protein|tara:strand:+ start:3497 stop:3637 length:141 start_codon:yes stop_codon:yes gene_type:complete
MSDLMLVMVITFSVIAAGYFLSISRADFSRHLVLPKKSKNKAKETV